MFYVKVAMRHFVLGDEGTRRPPVPQLRTYGAARNLMLRLSTAMWCCVLHVFFMSLVFNLPWAKGGHPSTERAILNRLLNSEKYDATIRPKAAAGKATQVLVDLTMISLGPVNDIQMEFSASFLLRQEWRDPRLKYDDLNKSIVISEKRLDSLWVPDLYFPNSKRASRHEITAPNVLILLSPDGTMLYSQRLSVTLACPMNLINFPMDKQTCHIDMESYSHTSTDLYYEFATERDAVNSRPGVQIPDFLITDVTVGNCQNKYTTGAYTCLRVDVSIEREIGFYATQTYVPSILIVVLSWASFWIDHEAVPARISVGLLTVLTITTQSSGARAQLPRVPYVKAIDVWMSACLVFVFAAYMEYAVVTVMFRRHKKVLKQDDSISQHNQSTKEPSRGEVKTGNGKPEMRNADYSKDRSRQVDNISKYGFPISFLVFNIVYWVYYLHLA